MFVKKLRRNIDDKSTHAGFLSKLNVCTFFSDELTKVTHIYIYFLNTFVLRLLYHIKTNGHNNSLKLFFNTIE